MSCPLLSIPDETVLCQFDRLTRRTGASGGSALTIFVWQTGALFDQVLNHYTSAPFPRGIDPSNPDVLQNLGGPVNGSIMLYNKNSSVDSTAAAIDTLQVR